MKKKRIGGSLLLAWALLAWTATTAGSEAQRPSNATTLLDSAFENLYGSDNVQTLDLIVSVPGSRPTRKGLQIIRRNSSRPGKALIRFLEPHDLRHTGVLVLQNTDALDDVYVYFPALRIVRRISSAQRADSFFGTDLSFEDVEPKIGSDYTASEVSYEVRNANCVGLEIVPREDVESTYERMALCVERERNLIHGVDYYRDGKVIKQLDIDVSSVQAIDGRYIPFAMIMRTLQTGSETKILTKRYEFVDAIPESVFSTRNLESGDAAQDRARLIVDQ